MIILFNGRYSPGLCKSNPNVLFVFGDNARRVGMGGQAIIREQINAVGVATKRSPAHFMEDGNPRDMRTMAEDMIAIETSLDAGRTIVLPTFRESGLSTLGCGLAQLPERCPALYAMINEWQARLVRTHEKQEYWV